MQLTPEATMGILALFGITVLGILFVLKRLKIIEFSWGNGGSVVVHCPDHKTFCGAFKVVRDEFKVVRDEHLLQHQTVEAHEKRLDEGKVIFGEIKADVGEIKADIKLIKFKLEVEDKGND